jgi:hypothetical protein
MVVPESTAEDAAVVLEEEQAMHDLNFKNYLAKITDKELGYARALIDAEVMRRNLTKTNPNSQSKT